MKAVIFDMDGVIVDSIGIHYGIWKGVCKEYGIDLDQDSYDELNGSPTSRISRILVEKFNLTVDPKELAEKKSSRSAEKLHGGIPLFPNVRETLIELKQKGYLIGLATSTLREHEQFTLEDNTSLFDKIITVDDIQNPKPAPDIFMKCAEELRVPYNESMVLEDSLNGITAAKSAGMIAVAITNTTIAEKFTHADYIISDIKEIIGIVDQL